jgi:hypothetical protein
MPADQPQALLRAMESRNRLFAFVDEIPTPSVVDAFIARPRAVKVWYDTEMRDPMGRPVPPHAAVHPFTMTQFGVTWNMSRAFVIEDRQRLQSVTRGQFADYVAMISLAGIKPSAHLRDVATILKLFDSPANAAPPGLSDRDKAFLKSLYLTDAESKLQQGSDHANHGARNRALTKSIPGGEGGIRTHGTREGTPVFKTGAFNRSATSPY